MTYRNALPLLVHIGELEKKICELKDLAQKQNLQISESEILQMINHLSLASNK